MLNKNLFISPIGNNPVLNHLTPNIIRNFDTLLICYADNFDDMFERFYHYDDVVVIKMKGYKFPLAKQIYNLKSRRYNPEHGELETQAQKLNRNAKMNLRKYDFVALVDDDVFTSDDDINRAFDIATKAGTKYAAPAIAQINYVHEIMFKRYGMLLRHTSWMETMFSIISAESLRVTVDYFDENKTSYGYPELFDKLLRKHFYPEDSTSENNDILTVIDDVEIIHTRNVGEGGGDGIYKRNNDSPMSDDIKTWLDVGEDDYQALFKKHKLTNKSPINYFTMFKGRVLTCVIITTAEDKDKYLNRCLLSLPTWSQVVVLETLESDEWSTEIHENGNGDKFGVLRWNAPKFPYATARNIAKGFADGHYILAIDADEVLNPALHDDLMLMLRDLSEPKNDKIGGVENYNLSYLSDIKDEFNSPLTQTGKQTRLFKNLPWINFRAEIHESVQLEIRRHGFKVLPSDLLIHHLGYKRSLPEMADKFRRNIETSLTYPKLLSDKDLFFNSIAENPIYDKLVKDIGNLKIVEALMDK